MMRLVGGGVALGLALALAGCGASEPNAEAREAGGDAVTSILNAGVSTQLGEAKFLFDPLYDNHFGSLAEMEQPLIEAIINGTAPYDNVDAVFVSHAHGDHFSPEYFNRLMAAQSSVRIVAPEQAIADMREHSLWQAGFEDRITAITLSNGEASKKFDIAGAIVEAIRTPHSGWPERHADVHNISYRVSATRASGDPVRVMHMGDADPAMQHFTMNSKFFCCARTNLVMVPFWFFREEGADMLIDRTLNAQSAVGVHVPQQVPAWLADSEWRYFTAEGQRAEIPSFAPARD